MRGYIKRSCKMQEYIIKSCKIRKDILSLLANQIQTEILNTDKV